MTSPLPVSCSDFVNELPAIRGKYTFGTPLSKTTWFRVGGPAEILFKPADTDDLAYFLKNRPLDLPIFCIGAGSNLLVRDGGISGCVIRLGVGFSQIEINDNIVTVGAGCLDRTIAMHCLEENLSGLEFLVGIPGTVGGAVAMNAGAYGSEVKDVVEWVEVIDFAGNIKVLNKNELNMSYRKGNLPKDSIVLKAAFRCTAKPAAEIQAKLQDFLQRREDSQPVKGRTGGSTFKNPVGDKKAWELIDQAGCRGLSIGDAQVSEKHCNFLLNLNAAAARDLELLGETVRQRVAATTGVELEWEIIRIGASLENE